MTLNRVPKIPGLPPDAERVLSESLNGILSELQRLGAAPRTTGLKRASYVASEGETVRMMGGNTLTLPRSRVENQGARVQLMAEGAGVVRVAAFRSTVNGQSAIRVAGSGRLTIFVSNGDGNWASTGDLDADATVSQSAAAAMPYSSTYHLQTADPRLPLARVGTPSTEIDLDYGTFGRVSWLLRTASIVLGKLADLTGLSVLGRAANSSGVMAAITATAARQTLTCNDAGTALAWGHPVEIRNNANTDLGDVFSIRGLNGTNTTVSVGAVASGATTFAWNVDDYPLTGLADQAAGTFLANITGGSAPPTAHSLTTFAGAGLTYTNVTGILAVGAGTGITVNANDVALSTGAAESFFGNFTAGAAVGTYRAGSSVAGAGLTYTAGGTLAVGAGTNVTVNANDIAVTNYPLSGLATQNARTVVANATNASAAPTAVQGTTARHVFRVNDTGTGLEWGFATLNIEEENVAEGSANTLDFRDGDGVDLAVLVSAGEAIITPTIDVSDFAGAGLEDDGSNNLRVVVDATAHGLRTSTGVGFRKSRRRHMWWEDFDFVEEFEVGGFKQFHAGNTTWASEGTAGGDHVFIAGEANHPGILRMTTSGALSSSATIFRGGDNAFEYMFTEDIYALELVARIVTATSVLVDFGFANDATGTVTDRIIFEFDTNSDTSVHTLTEEADTTTNNDTGFIPGTGWNVYTILQETPGTVEFYIDDLLETTHSTNVPDAEGVNVFARVLSRTANARSLDLDYIAFESQDLGARTS